MNNLSLTLPGGETIQAPGGVPNARINDILPFVVTTLFVFAIILTLFFLILGGISFITSGGDKQKVVQARLRLTYAVVGLIIIFLSFFIVNIIGGFFGVNLLSVSPPLDPCINARPGQPC